MLTQPELETKFIQAIIKNNINCLTKLINEANYLKSMEKNKQHPKKGIEYEVVEEHSKRPRKRHRV